MRRDVPKLRESMPITVAAAVMCFERLHCVPVVSDANKLVGIVSALSVLEWIAREAGYVLPRRTSRQTDPVPRIAAHRVLVADDDADMRRLVSHALGKDGCEVIEVADGAELLEYMGSCLMAKLHVSRPEVIIADIRMPGFNGLQILAGLRNAKWKTPVILITALDDRKTYQDAARLGAAACFQKPFDPNHLRRIVRELVR
jgi:CheY-like chemotaxis protein